MGNRRVSLIFIGFVIVVTAGLFWLVTRHIQSERLAGLVETASVTAENLTLFRSFYSSEIAAPLAGSGVAVTHEFRDVPNAIPLPATMSLEFGAFLNHAQRDFSVKLYSEYPFPWRKDRRLDAVERDALAKIRLNPSQPVQVIDETKDGEQLLRFFSPVTMGESCVACHNNHDDSPRTDWTLGEVRGVQQVILPVNGATNANLFGQATFRDIVLFASASILLGFVFIAVMGRRNARAMAALENSAQRESKRSAELAEARDRAEDASRAKSRFLAMMSHEIRTPLNGVMGALGLLSSRISDSEDRRLVDTGSVAAENLLRLINDILDFSKMEADKLELEPSISSTRECVSQVIQAMEPNAAAKRIAIDAQIDKGLPEYLMFDGDRLRQILFNLVGNAIKFTVRGKVTVKAHHSVHGQRVRLHLSVIDTGIGIPSHRIGRLFDEFESRANRDVSGMPLTAGSMEQAEIRFAPGFQGGTGLGLAISQRLTKMMGGDIGVKSTVGDGTTFHFTIMADPVSADMLKEAEAQKRILVADHFGALRGRVLLAEDNPANQLIAKAMLSQFGVQTDVVGNGLEAVAAVKARPYDAVLMDIGMPEMDGIEATQEIRKLGGGYADLPIIALTAHVMRGDREAILAQGLNAFLAKPVRLNELYVALSHYLESTQDDEPLSAEGDPSPHDKNTDTLIDTAAPVAAVAGPPVIDAETVDQLKDLLGEDDWHQYVATFRQDLEQQLSQLSSGLPTKDEIKNIAHSIKGAAGNFGALALSQAAADLEVAPKDALAVENLMSAAQTLFERLDA